MRDRELATREEPRDLWQVPHSCYVVPSGRELEKIWKQFLEDKDISVNIFILLPSVSAD